MGTSGKVEVLNGTDVKWSGPGGEWAVPIASLGVIAEFTNQDGPSDDWFVALLERSGCLYEFPATAEGTCEVLDSLGEHVGIELDLALVSSTTFRSRVMHPLQLKERPFFSYRRIQRQGLMGVVGNWLGLQDVESCISKEVLDYLGLGQ